MILLAMAAALIRLFDLGKLPLSPTEASEALAVWRFWQPGAEAAVGSPAYFSFTSLLPPMLGDTDFVMRLVPALFGLGIVILPWFLRRQLGVVGALVTSLLLVISPLQSIVSRTAGGDAIALFALFFMIVATLRYEDTADSRWLAALLAALSLGLTSSPLFYSGLFSMILLANTAWRGLSNKNEPGISGIWLKPILLAITIFLAVSTLVLWHLPGLGAAAALPAQWLSQFRFSGVEWGDPFLALIRYEPFMVLAGVTAVIWAWFSGDLLAKRLVRWTAGVLLLLLVQQGQMDNLALLLLPVSILIGLLVKRLYLVAPSRLGWAWAGGLFVLEGLMIINLARYSRVITQTPQDFTSAWIIMMALTFLIVTVYFLSSWDSTAVIQGTFLGLLAFFALYHWGNAWWLTHEAANDPRTRWVDQAADDDIRYLIQSLEEISRQATNSDHEIDSFSSVDTPVLRWYLRDFTHLQFGDSLPLGAQQDAIISPELAELALGSEYAGADYGLLRTGVTAPEFTSQTPVLDIMRWWLFHESSFAIREERVILWWRTDLSDGS